MGTLATAGSIEWQPRLGDDLMQRMEADGLSDLERELLELCSMSGETTTTLDEEMLEASPGREVVEATLRGLLGRGLLTTKRGVYAGLQFARDGSRSWHREYEDDWWDVTPSGRRAIGLPT
jgi:hypothetical protein